MSKKKVQPADRELKLVLKRDDLSFATQAVHRLVNPQSSLPILSNVLIRAEQGRVEFITSDLEANVKCTIQAEIEGQFQTTVPATTFANLVKELPDADVELALEDDHARVTCQSLKYQLATQDPLDFPSWPEIEPKAVIEVSQLNLKRAIESVIFAIPARDPRKVLLGALFDIDGKRFVCVGTDGKKLGYHKFEVESHTGEEQISAIAPHKILTEVAGALKSEGLVTVQIGERQIAFNLGPIVYVSNKLEGTYPNYNRVIPTEFERTMKIGKEGLSHLIRQASIIADRKNNSVKFRFNDGTLNVEANTYDVGSFAGNMNVEYQGGEFDIVFNHHFVAEVLRIIENETIELKTNKSVSPAVFQGVADSDSLFVIMPIKLTDLADTPEEDEE